MFEFKVKKTKEVDYASLVLWSLVAILSVMILVRFPKIVIPTGASKADSSVVFVVENLDLSAAQEKVLRAAPGVAESLGYNACYRLDKDQPKAKPFVEAAAKRYISSSFSGVKRFKILSIQPFPTLNSLGGSPRLMFETFTLPDGSVAATGKLLPKPLDTTVFASYPSQRLLEKSDIKSLLSEDRYKFVRESFKPWMIDQGQVGKCNASAAVSAMYQVRWKLGAAIIPLADNFLYMHINGGRDQGSLLDKGLDFIRKFGVCPRNIVSRSGKSYGHIPHTSYNVAQLDKDLYAQAQAQATRFIVHEPYVVPKDYEGFKETLATAAALEYPVVMAWDVSQASMKLRNGYVQTGRGRGNHASLFSSAKWVGGKDLVHLDLRNSWGANESVVFGPRSSGWGEEGYGLMTMEQAYQCREYHEFYVLSGINFDPWVTI